MADTSYAIALGSNRRHGRHGSPEQVILAAIDALGEAGLRVKAVSPIIRTAAWGPAGRGFANAAILLETPLDPPALLRLLKRIERGFGRRRGRRWGQRVLDLDIVLWSGGTWPRFPVRAAPGRLAIPHAGLAERAFVLTPLTAIASEWHDPRSGRTVGQLRARLMRGRPVDRRARRP
jgi:2-amino-4-hydroxy-6-hydroxymethyldihydropteridine diphosphokinase